MKHLWYCRGVRITSKRILRADSWEENPMEDNRGLSRPAELREEPVGRSAVARYRMPREWKMVGQQDRARGRLPVCLWTGTGQCGVLSLFHQSSNVEGLSQPGAAQSLSRGRCVHVSLTLGLLWCLCSSLCKTQNACEFPPTTSWW